MFGGYWFNFCQRIPKPNQVGSLRSEYACADDEPLPIWSQRSGNPSSSERFAFFVPDPGHSGPNRTHAAPTARPVVTVRTGLADSRRPNLWELSSEWILRELDRQG